ncbi:MAG: hypothetical protein LBC33_00900 [Mycoplasmataceae bacterium]|nr:hypothetical protein [Mycoplasmataceae bacterium]
MQVDNKEIIDYINKEIDDYNGFAKGFYEDIKEWKQSSKSKNKKLSEEEKDFETDTSNQIHIRSIKDLSPYLVCRINKVDGVQRINDFRLIHFFTLHLLIIVITSFIINLFSTPFPPSNKNKNFTPGPFWVDNHVPFTCIWVFLTIFLFISIFELIFFVYKYTGSKKNRLIYDNIRAHILTYYYDRKNFNGAQWQINRDTFLNNMKCIGKFNLLAIRLTEIGKDPASKEWWKLVKVYARYCFLMNSFCSLWFQADYKKKIMKVTQDPVKWPIKYVQLRLFFIIFILSILFMGIAVWTISLKNLFLPGYVCFPYIFLALILVIVVWTIIFVFRLQSDFNKVLLAIKPLFPNDIYEDFVNLIKNGIKNAEYAPSYWFVDRVKRVDKNDKWR